jgi:hypothetical protein
VSVGQTARFGRTEWADFSFPDDPLMRDVHFAVECNHSKSVLRSLENASDTSVAGVPVSEVQIHTGDEITAGGTVFSVVVDGEAPSDRGNATWTSAVTKTQQSLPPENPVPKSLLEICEFVKVDEATCALAKDQTGSILEFAEFLASERHYMPALRLMAHHLPRREAVWWGSLCLRESVGHLLTKMDLAALDAADHWVRTGHETDRRKANDAADASKFETAAAWVALGAFWAEGSLAPIGLEDVIPDERLTGQAITGALLMAAGKANPLKAEATYKSYLAIAKTILSGKTPAPKN